MGARTRTFIIIILCIQSIFHGFLSFGLKKLNLKILKKQAIISGIILTILGLGYSTLQTGVIIKAIKQNSNN